MTAAETARALAATRLMRLAQAAKKTGIASGLVGLGVAMHALWHALPLFQAVAGGIALACRA